MFRNLLPCIIFDKHDKPFIYRKNSANKKIELYDADEEKSFEIEYKKLSRYKKVLFIQKH